MASLNVLQKGKELANAEARIEQLKQELREQERSGSELIRTAADEFVAPLKSARAGRIESSCVENLPDCRNAFVDSAEPGKKLAVSFF